MFERFHRLEEREGTSPGEEYQAYYLGAYDFGANSMLAWIGTTGGVDPKVVKAIYVDRFIFVKETNMP